MSECFQVSTILVLSDRSEVHAPLNAYDSEGEAEKAKTEIASGVGGLLESAVITVKMPDGKVVSPMTLKQFIATLGIAGVGQVVRKVPIHGAVVLSAQPNLILLQ
jgi:hypothetical protein